LTVSPANPDETSHPLEPPQQGTYTVLACNIDEFFSLWKRKFQEVIEDQVMNGFLTVNGVYFGVNPKTTNRRLWAKAIPAYKVGQQWRIAKKDLKWLRG
jgi:hypothetical protein